MLPCGVSKDLSAQLGVSVRMGMRKFINCKRKYALQQLMIIVEKVTIYVEEELRKRLEEEKERKKKSAATSTLVSKSSLAVSLSTLNIDVNKAANDNPHPFSDVVIKIKTTLFVYQK